MEPLAYQNLEIIWDYMHLRMELRPADCIVGFGNYNTAIAVRAAELYHQKLAPKILFSGGLGRNTDGRWSGSEAARFAELAVREGVPQEDIILEKGFVEVNAEFFQEVFSVEPVLKQRKIF